MKEKKPSNTSLAPASFCKCTCFTNSTIIPLDPPKPESSSFAANLLHRDDEADTIDKRANSYQALSCNDCNKKFCLGYDLPVCKGAKEDDVVSTCFRTLSLFLFRSGCGGVC